MPRLNMVKMPIITLCAQFLSPVRLCDPLDYSPGSSIHGISRARILEWVAVSSSRDLPDSGIEPTSLAFPALAGRLFTTELTGKPGDYNCEGQRPLKTSNFQVWMKKINKEAFSCLVTWPRGSGNG